MVESVAYFLSLYRPKVSGRLFRLALESSPFYPSALSFERTLSFFGLDVKVVHVSEGDISRLPSYFLAFIRVGGREDTALIRRCSPNKLEIFNPANSLFQSLPQQKLDEVWTGVVLYTEDSLPSGLARCRTSWPKSRKWLFLMGIIIALGLSIVSSLMIGLALLGFMLSMIMLLSNENSDPPFCRLGSHVDCRRVAMSRYSLVLGSPLSLYSTAFFAFVLMLHFFLMLQGIDPVPYDQILGDAVFVVSIPVTIYSLHSQYRIETLCLYCLCIVLITFVIGVFYVDFSKRIYWGIVACEGAGYFLSFALFWQLYSLRQSHRKIDLYRKISYRVMRDKSHVRSLSTISERGSDVTSSDSECSILICLGDRCRACLHAARELCTLAPLISPSIHVKILVFREGQNRDDLMNSALEDLSHKIGASSISWVDPMQVAPPERIPTIITFDKVMPRGSELLLALLTAWDYRYYKILQ